MNNNDSRKWALIQKLKVLFPFSSAILVFVIGEKVFNVTYLCCASEFLTCPRWNGFAPEIIYCVALEQARLYVTLAQHLKTIKFIQRLIRARR